MAGRKNFVAGEILTAADVNSFLMDQSVMVFDDSAARTTAIPTPTEGMVTYLKDSNSVEVFDGSAFGQLGGILNAYTVTKTNAFSTSGINSPNQVAITGLSISGVAASSATSRLLIMVTLGHIGSSRSEGYGVGVHDGTSIVALGDAVGVRIQVTSGVRGVGNPTGQGMLSLQNIITPGDTTARTYEVRIIAGSESTTTYHVNRDNIDNNTGDFLRSVSTMHILELPGGLF